MGDFKRFKVASVDKTREFADDHPFKSKSGKTYAISSMSAAAITSPSGRPISVFTRRSRSQGSRSMDEVDERIEASRQNTLGLFGASDQRRQAAFKSIEQYWDYNHPCGHCGRVWLRGSSVGLRKKCCQGGRMCVGLHMPISFKTDASSVGYWIF